MLSAAAGSGQRLAEELGVTASFHNPFTSRPTWSEFERAAGLSMCLRLNTLRMLRTRLKGKGDMPDSFEFLFPKARASQETRALFADFHPDHVQLRHAIRVEPFGSTKAMHLSSSKSVDPEGKVDTDEGSFTWGGTILINAERAPTWDLMHSTPNLFIAIQCKKLPLLSMIDSRFEFLKAMGSARTLAAGLDPATVCDEANGGIGAGEYKKSKSRKKNVLERADSLDSFYGSRQGVFVVVCEGDVEAGNLPRGMIVVKGDALRGTMFEPLVSNS